MIIDATNLILGRMCSVAAKQALLGEKILVVNCEKAVVSGARREVLATYKQMQDRVTVATGPFRSRMPDRFIRRTIRGMLPYKKEKGSKAFDRVMCYIGVPKELEGKQMETIDEANVIKRNVVQFVTVADICQELGAGTHE